MLRILALIFMASLLLGPALARAGLFEEKIPRREKSDAVDAKAKQGT